MTLIIFEKRSNESKRLETIKVRFPEELIYPNKGIGYYKFSEDLNLQLHSEQDLPALYIISPLGETWTEWFKDGKCHRDNDKPAAIYFNSETNHFSYKWFQNGLLHREKAPAYINTNGTLEWYNHGRISKPKTK